MSDLPKAKLKLEMSKAEYEAAARHLSTARHHSEQAKTYIEMAKKANVRAKDLLEEAEALAADETSVKPLCSDHNPIQHRDAKEPWCEKCKLTKDFLTPVSMLHNSKKKD